MFSGRNQMSVTSIATFMKLLLNDFAVSSALYAVDMISPTINIKMFSIFYEILLEKC
jgi:hypothetical protein